MVVIALPWTNSTQLLRANADKDLNMPKPGDTTYQAIHRAWFTDMFAKGIAKLQQQFVDAAKYLIRMDDYDDLPSEIRTVVDSLAGGSGLETAKDLCEGVFVYP